MNEDFDVDSEEESGGNEWLATYGDLVTLLLCFFCTFIRYVKYRC